MSDKQVLLYLLTCQPRASKHAHNTYYTFALYLHHMQCMHVHVKLSVMVKCI